jgi:hypothetical protein
MEAMSALGSGRPTFTRQENPRYLFLLEAESTSEK